MEMNCKIYKFFFQINADELNSGDDLERDPRFDDLHAPIVDVENGERNSVCIFIRILYAILYLSVMILFYVVVFS